MPQPLAIVLYERVMPGSHLVNRLQDLKYRVLAVNDADQLASAIQSDSPLIAFVDLEAKQDVCPTIQRIKADKATAHLPIVAFAPDNKTKLLASAHQVGANLIVGESRLVNQLPQLLEQALSLE